MQKNVFQLIILIIIFFVAPFPAFPQDYCSGDFDYDSDVDGADAFQFKADFGRNLLKNPCPPSGPVPVPKTGQITSYAPGDDGDLQKGFPRPNPRFTDRGNGTVKDNLTGLIWLKNANCFGLRNWNQALSDSTALAAGVCGLADNSSASDWRMPSILEIITLVDFEKSAPGTPLVATFDNVSLILDYWTSTTFAYDPTYAYVADGVLSKSSNSLVWPVRDSR